MSGHSATHVKERNPPYTEITPKNWYLSRIQRLTYVPITSLSETMVKSSIHFRLNKFEQSPEHGTSQNASFAQVLGLQKNIQTF